MVRSGVAISFQNMSTQYEESEEDPFHCSDNSDQDPDYIEKPGSSGKSKYRPISHIAADDIISSSDDEQVMFLQLHLKQYLLILL